MRLHTAGVISSVGRASPLHGGGRRFEPVITHHQLDGSQCSSKSVETWAISSVGRASPLHGGGRRFEPVIAHHASTQNLTPKWVISSVGRASPLHGGGRRFEPVITHHFGSLAQLVEQLTFNQLVAGSNPARPTIFREKHPMGAFFVSRTELLRAGFEPAPSPSATLHHNKSRHASQFHIKFSASMPI